MKRSNCTQRTMGYVKELKFKGQDFPTIITVEYQVEGKCYAINESLKLQCKKIKLGPITLGQKKIPIIKTAVGETLAMLYNPDAPEEAYIEENIGTINI